MSTWQGNVLRGTRAAQPAAASVVVGAIYGVTDEGNILERSTGAAWEAFSPGAGSTSVTAASVITDNAIVRGDGGARGTQLSLITISDTGALTVPDDVRQTFNPGATVAGLNVGALAGDPSTPINGDLWYDSTANELTARINGASVALGAASAGGGLVLLETQTASASATLDFTTGITSTYDDYVLELVNLVNATNAQDLWLRVSTDAGTTFETTAYEFIYWNNSTSNVGLASTAGTAQAAIILAPGTDNSQSYGSNFRINIRGPLSATLKKSFDFSGTFVLQAVARRYYQTGGGFWDAVTAVNALRLLYASGNITSGVARLYGVAK